MSPVEQWKAIEKLVSDRWTEEAISTALALPVRTLQKLRLLARIHPPMLDRMHAGDMPGERDLRVIASAPLDEQAAAWKQNKPKKNETVTWWQLARALARRRMRAADALFDAEFAAAYGVDYSEDLFAPADEDSRATTNVEGWRAETKEYLRVTIITAKALASSRGHRLARVAFLGSCVALGASLLAQAFLAGVAAMTDPSWWGLHVAWVHTFQWLVLLPPACAVLAGYPRRLVWASALPVVLLYLQYVWAEFGRDGTWAYGLGVHAASGLLLFGTTMALFAAVLVAAPRQP